jgi:hypothetical protein
LRTVFPQQYSGLYIDFRETKAWGVNHNLSSLDGLLRDITRNSRTITLAFDEPRIKPAVLLSLVKRFIVVADVTFVDFDLQFSSILQNLDDSSYRLIDGRRHLSVMQPSNKILDFVGNISSKKINSQGVMILDSLNSLQAILTDDSSTRGSKSANQKTALIVTVLENICRFYSKSLLIVNITKARPVDAESSDSFWEKRIVGGRMIRYKSDMVLSAKQIFSLGVPEVEINVQKSSHLISGQKFRMSV